MVVRLISCILAFVVFFAICEADILVPNFIPRTYFDAAVQFMNSERSLLDIETKRVRALYDQCKVKWDTTANKCKACLNNVDCRSMSQRLTDFAEGLVGRRRRGSPMMAEAPRIERSLTDEQKACMRKCSDCSPWLSGNSYFTLRAICGDSYNDFPDSNDRLKRRYERATGFINEINSASKNSKDLMTNVYMESASNRKITRLTALKGGNYINYRGLGFYYIFWNEQEGYKNLAKFMLTQY